MRLAICRFETCSAHHLQWNQLFLHCLPLLKNQSRNVQSGQVSVELLAWIFKHGPSLENSLYKWVTPMDELYVIEKLWPNAKALATSVSERDGKTYPAVWVNQYGKARVFGTTYGHSDDMWRDENFLTLVSRGTLWTTGRLGE